MMSTALPLGYRLYSVDPQSVVAFYAALMGWRVEALGAFSGEDWLRPLARRHGLPSRWVPCLGNGGLAHWTALGGRCLSGTELRRDSEGAWSLAGSTDLAAGRSVVSILCTQRPQQALARYADLCGWEAHEGSSGAAVTGTWTLNGRLVGRVTAPSSPMAACWWPCFSVVDVAAAQRIVRAEGGLVITSIDAHAWGVEHLCVDPSGAPFALVEQAQ